MLRRKQISLRSHKTNDFRPESQRKSTSGMFIIIGQQTFCVPRMVNNLITKLP